MPTPRRAPRFGGSAQHQRLMMANMAASLFAAEGIKTTEAKAKEAGCTACHMVERKVVGPSYADVAEKYENTPENVAILTDHVINGNVGNWGEIQMPSHPQLERADVEDMIKYVLLLKR